MPYTFAVSLAAWPVAPPPTTLLAGPPTAPLPTLLATPPPPPTGFAPSPAPPMLPMLAKLLPALLNVFIRGSPRWPAPPLAVLALPPMGAPGPDPGLGGSTKGSAAAAALLGAATGVAQMVLEEKKGVKVVADMVGAGADDATGAANAAWPWAEPMPASPALLTPGPAVALALIGLLQALLPPATAELAGAEGLCCCIGCPLGGRA